MPRPQLVDSPFDPQPLKDSFHRAMDQVNALIVGKPDEVALAFTCLLAGGHLLLDDLPGMGKTTLARAMAATLGLSFQRVQFTSDLLPSDIVGVSVLDKDEQVFRFHQGPIFSEVLLADEINRASPRTQSALLEAMAEHQVSIDRQTHRLPDPFFVIATQNPIDLVGTFPLPDAQLDRFLLRISLGYPSPEAELELMRQEDRQDMLEHTQPLLGREQVRQLRKQASKMLASEPLLRYIQSLVQATRHHAAIRAGLSPRAGLALLKVSRAHAYLMGRDAVLPDDVQAVFCAVAAHRLAIQASGNGTTSQSLAEEILRATPLP